MFSIKYDGTVTKKCNDLTEDVIKHKDRRMQECTCGQLQTKNSTGRCTLFWLYAQHCDIHSQAKDIS